MALGTETLVELLGEGAENHRLTHLLGGLGGQAQILEHQVAAEAAAIEMPTVAKTKTWGVSEPGAASSMPTYK